MEVNTVFRGIKAFVILIFTFIACYITGTTAWTLAGAMGNNSAEWLVKTGILITTIIAIVLIPILIAYGAELRTGNIFKGLIMMWIATVPVRILVDLCWNLIDILATEGLLKTILQITIIMVMFMIIFVVPNAIMFSQEEIQLG